MSLRGPAAAQVPGDTRSWPPPDDAVGPRFTVECGGALYATKWIGDPEMAQRVQVLFEDDIDGSVAEETVTFGLDGSLYEIDRSV